MAIKIDFQSVFQTTTAPAIALGTRAETPDGRVWTYVKAGGSGIIKNALVIPAADVAVDEVSSSTDSQGRIVYITKASAGWTPGQFTNSWVVVDAGTGAGQTAQIMGNTADTLQLYPAFALSTALDVADSDITICSPYTVLVSATSSLLQNTVGVAQIAFASGEYGWVLTQGVGTVIGTSLVAGEYFTSGGATAGYALALANGETIDDVQILGRALAATTGTGVGTLAYINIT